MAAKTAADAVPDPGRAIYLDEAKHPHRSSARRRDRICRAAGLVLVQSLLHLGRQDHEACPAPMSARPFGPMCWAGSPICCWPPRAIRRCCSISINLASMGPNSIAGINRTRGLNENLARETLELHTLGVRSGYTQDDVISFANVLTGWTLVPAGDNPEHGGEFSFNPRLHEPGAQKVMGKVYEQEGVEQGRAVLRDLAAHPATAAHLADEAGPLLHCRYAAARRWSSGMTKSFPRHIRRSQGGRRAMVSSDDAWTQPSTKLKRPSEWVIGMMRATGVNANRSRRGSRMARALLGEPLWRPSSPKGYPDDEASWIDGMGRRLDVANNFAERVAGRVDPQDVMDNVLGSSVSARGEAGGGPAPKAASRRSRCCSCRPNSKGGEHDVSPPFAQPSRSAARRRRAVRLESNAEAGARGGPRPAHARRSCCGARWTDLGAVAPVGDPDWVGLRGDRALVLDGKTPALPLDSFFALNPAMPNLHRLYKAQQATIVHATATPYRERSHFDGQDVLESGIARPGAVDYGLAQSRAGRDGNRTVRWICAAAARSASGRSRLWWCAAGLRSCHGCRKNCFRRATIPRPDCWIFISTPIRNLRLRSKHGCDLRHLGTDRGMRRSHGGRARHAAPGIARVRAYFAEVAGTAARFLAKPDGPRVGAVGLRRVGYAHQ